jgi:ribosomal protein S13
LVRLRLNVKKAPALTMPSARSLLTIALRERGLDLDRAMEIVRYHHVRNDAAYQSHRQRTQQTSRQRRWPLRVNQISL